MASTTGFYAFSASHPERAAVVAPDGETLTFGELASRVNRLSHGLRALGLAHGDVVAAAVHNGVEYLELMLATGQVGLRVVPLNWHLAPAELAYILRDSAARAFVADAEQAARLDRADLPEHRFATRGNVDGWRQYAQMKADQPDTPPPERVAGGLMAYTSGTTGHPKGVKSPLPSGSPDELARMWMALLSWYGQEPGDGVHLVCSPLYHAAPGGHAMGFLHAGHTVVIQSRFDAEAVLRDIERHRVTTSHMVPTHFHRLLRLPADVRGRYDLSSLRMIVHAGAPCPIAQKRQMLDWLGPIVWEYLAATEGAMSLASPQDWLAKPGTVGRAAPGAIVKVLDAAGAEAAPGRPGTIYFGTVGRAPTFEYHNDPVKTAENRAGDLVTVGDYGYLDEDGYLFMLDRRTDLIISGGVNIYPAEVEQHLIAHPAVADVAVIGVPDPEWGQSVVAVVQPADDVTPDEALADRLRAFCADGLAAFKRPRRVEFVTEFPRTESGKLQRRRLREAYIEGAAR